MSQPRFKFVGEPKLPNSEKKPFVEEFVKEYDDGKKVKMAKLNLGIKEGKNSIVFVEAFGSVQKIIKTKDNDNKDIEVEWDNRFDKDSIKQVANYRKYVVDLGDEFGGRHEFITQWDFIKYLEENLPKYNGKICVNGQWNKQPYQGKYYDKFPITSVYAVSDDEVSRFYITADIYYRKDCIDKSEWKKDKKMYIDGFIQMYISKEEGTKFVPQRFAFSGAKYKENNEQHQKLLAYKLKYVENDSKKWGHLLWDVIMLNGTETVEFDESQLTAAQKEQIELGIRTLDDFRPRGDIFGNIVYEYRLNNPSLVKISDSDDFSNGFVTLDLTDKEFDEMVYVQVEDEKLSDVMANTNKDSNGEEYKGSTDKEVDGLFDGMNKPEEENKEETKDADDISDDDLF